jgi:hypothetical protein
MGGRAGAGAGAGGEAQPPREDNSSDQPPSKPKRRSIMGRLRDEQYVKPSRPSSRHVKDADLVKPRMLREPSITRMDDSGEKAPAAAAPVSRTSKMRNAPAPPPPEYIIEDVPSRHSSSVNHTDPESIFKPQQQQQPSTLRSSDHSTAPEKPNSMPSISSFSRSGHLHQPEDEGDDATAKPGSAPNLPNSRPNLNRKSLESVRELKNSIKLMRVNRRKVKFSESTHKESTHSDVGATTTTTSAGGGGEPTNTNMSNSNNNLGHNVSSFTTLGSSGSSLTTASFSPRIGVGLTMQDLEMMGSLKQSRQNQQQQQARGGADPALQHDLKVASLQKQVKKTKKLVKRTTRDVWAERDEIVNLQRKNWSIRKTLVQTDAPRDSVTSFNLSIAKLVRQERELDLSMDQMKDEKQLLESECVPLRQSIDNFNDLLHQLNGQILPLLPNSSSDDDDDDDDDEQQPPRRGFGFGIHPISMVAPSPAMTIEDSLSDSIHSTEEVEDNFHHQQQRQQQNNANATSQNARNNSRILSPA